VRHARVWDAKWRVNGALTGIDAARLPAGADSFACDGEVAMKMKLVEQDGVVQITLSGRMDMLGVEDVSGPFNDAVGERKALVAVDLSQVDFLASVGLRLLFANARNLHQHGGKMALAAAQPAVQDVLEASGVPKVIPVYASVSEACSELRDGD
jgi:anti-anti-sigma factor